MKVCGKCHEEKPLTEFWAAKSAADGKQTYCKVCAKTMSKGWREANIERARAREAAWRAANIERARAREAAWRAANPEKIKARWDAWRAANADKVKAAHDAWRAANPEKIKANKENQRTKKMAAKAAWFEANKDAITKPIKTPEEWSQ